MPANTQPLLPKGTANHPTDGSPVNDQAGPSTAQAVALGQCSVKDASGSPSSAASAQTGPFSREASEELEVAQPVKKRNPAQTVKGASPSESGAMQPHRQGTSRESCPDKHEAEAGQPNRKRSPSEGKKKASKGGNAGKAGPKKKKKKEIRGKMVPKLGLCYVCETTVSLVWRKGKVFFPGKEECNACGTADRRGLLTDDLVKVTSLASEVDLLYA